MDTDNPNERAVVAGGGGSGSVSVVPVSMIVRAVRTLSSPPFLRRGGVTDAANQRGVGGSDIPPRLQLAAISVLQVLVSGQGAEYVVKATAAASAGREAEPEEGEVDGEEKEKEAGDLEKDEGERFTYIENGPGEIDEIGLFAVVLVIVLLRAACGRVSERLYMCHRGGAVASLWEAIGLLAMLISAFVTAVHQPHETMWYPQQQYYRRPLTELAIHRHRTIYPNG